MSKEGEKENTFGMPLYIIGAPTTGAKKVGAVKGGVVGSSTPGVVAPDGVSKEVGATNAAEASGVAERPPESARVVPPTVAVAGKTGAVVDVNPHVGPGDKSGTPSRIVCAPGVGAKMVGSSGCDAARPDGSSEEGQATGPEEDSIVP